MTLAGLRTTLSREILFKLSFLVFVAACLFSFSGCAGVTASPNDKGTPPPPGSLSISTSSLSGGSVGTAYSATLQATGGTTPYSWSLASGSLPAGLTLNASSGIISGTPTQSGSFAFTAEVTDASSPVNTATKALTIVVAAAGALAITTASLPNGTVGTIYSAVIQATGGTSPYTWGVSGVSLPAGLNLNSSTGVISGTPTAAGTFSFTVQVTDAAKNTATKALSITVTGSGSGGLSITTTTLPNGTLNQAYAATLQASGGTPPYTWSITSGQLPNGLSLSSTGQISGTPTANGQSGFTASVKDSSSTPQTASQGLVITVGAVSLDQYGGRTDIKCANATGWFHVEEINKHWWFCTPLGNAFYSLGVTYTPATIHGTFAPADVNRRLESWGFNTVQVGAHSYQTPVVADCSKFPTDSNGICSNPIKMPFVISVNAAYYAMSNPSISGPNAPLLTNPVKNMIAVYSPYYTGYKSVGIADYYDSGIGTWLQKDIQQDTGALWSALKTSPYANYIIGIASDDGDYMNGFGAGPDFATVPPSNNNYNLAMQVAAMSPLETADTNVADRSGSNFVYTDTLLHSKLALRNMLATEYSTIAALNSAWSSNYTTFDSSGTCVGTQPITCSATASADSVGTGNGSTVTFSTTLSRPTVSKFSLQILVGGTPVAGDLGNGTLYGPNLSTGSINYSTGALSLTFSSAPASGAAITATYVANGWGIGSGFLDEDARPTHLWMGTDWIGMTNANPTTKADMNNFLEQVAAQYFSTMRTQIKAVYPNIMYLGPNTLGTWGAPSSAPVLKAAAQYIDAFIGGGGTGLYSQAEMDYVEQNYGNKPYFNGWYSSANQDSAMGAYPDPVAVLSSANQPARALVYYNALTAQLETAHTTAGDYPYIGMYWWDYTDQASQNYNDGLVTPSDNAYDGHEAAAGAVPCSAPISTYTCGNEPTPGGLAVRPFGNLIGGATGVAAANALWLTVP